MTHLCYATSAMDETLQLCLKSMPMRNDKTFIVNEKNKQQNYGTPFQKNYILTKISKHIPKTIDEHNLAYTTTMKSDQFHPQNQKSLHMQENRDDKNQAHFRLIITFIYA